MTNAVPVPDATDPTDLSRASRVASNLSRANRGLSRGMTNTVPVPDATDPTHLSRASRVASNLSRANRGMSNSILRAHQVIGDRHGTVPRDAMADLSRASRVASNLSRANR